MSTDPSPPVCLVVDDEPRLRQVILHLMRNDGFRCYEAGDGADALTVLERYPATLVLSDIRMPKMDGIELLRQVRARYPETAVMMLTAVADVESAVSCFAIGALDYLTKPFNLEEVRARVSQALERLEDKVAIQARRLEELFLASIQSLAEALEVKDPYTRGHSVRVSHYAAVIARTLGLDDEMLRQIELGGHVHDIGKIGVRESVLNKPGPLTPEEYEHIMSHPVVGWRILSPLLAETPAALNIVRSHHERFDGRGVPDRLKGTAIPIEARIAAVADSLDAMSSSRPYRPALPGWGEAVEELRRHSGTQFDPEVVDAVVTATAAGQLMLIPRAESAVLPSRLRTPVRSSTVG
jgi:putative two-component system response regulator